MTVSKVRARKQRVFGSVFQVDASQPTPAIASVQPGEPFGGAVPPPQGPLADHDGSQSRTSGLTSPRRRQQSRTAAHDVSAETQLHHGGQSPSRSQGDEVADQVRWDRAWHAVTSRIQLPMSVTLEDSFGTLPAESQAGLIDADFNQALSLVLSPKATVPRATHTEDVVSWHIHQVRQHFIHHVLPLVAACASQTEPRQALVSCVNTLEAAHRLYLYGLKLIVRGYDHFARAAKDAIARFRHDLKAIVGNSWSGGLSDALRHVLHELIMRVIGASGSAPTSDTILSARQELLELLESLHRVHLAGARFHVLFAEAMDACMEEYIRRTYAGVWKTYFGASQNQEPNESVGCIGHLSDWVENQYGRLAVEVLSRIGGQVAWGDVERWKDIAIGRLASLRIHELYDIVLRWPQSKGGVEDLRAAVSTPQRRLELTDAFSAMLQKRLLHPGRSTLEILQTYISMIRAFHALDQSKVLLDRVVHALQLYLCQRDDAIRIVVTGLLSNPKTVNEEDGKTKLVELATILSEPSERPRRQADDDELDWNDMTWVPDPVDAGVNYKRPKNQDVIGTLISALGSQDIFIKEFQLIIAERLLDGSPNFTQEARVLSLLKKRFGEHALQNCDVMIKDIQDSRRIGSVITKSIRASNLAPQETTFDAKILSRLFWPSLSKDGYQLPQQVVTLQQQYEAGFEQLKSSRKLGWMNQLGTAVVKLELDDRTVELECKTYEAAVINAFGESGEDQSSMPVQRTFNELWESLMIDEDLLDLAVRFWISHRVLRDLGNQTYTVLESLEDEDGIAESAAQNMFANASSDTRQSSPKRTEKGMDAKENERRAIYWQFIVGMLTNSGPAMPLGQIAMMMKMLIADGCPWSNEELQEFLGEKIAAGELELSGGKYRLPKK